MNTKTKRRMVVVAGIIVIVVILLLAVLGSGNAAKVVTVSDVLGGNYKDSKIQVSGTVVDNSYSVNDSGVLTFQVRDEGAVSGESLNVSYDKGVSATFGNGITAICTGRLNDKGVLECTELVTKCPSKYENASDALTVEQLLAYGNTMNSKTAKVDGTVKAGSLASATSDVRLVLLGSDGTTELKVVYAGALSDDVKDGAKIVVTGALQESGKFLASDISLEG